MERQGSRAKLTMWQQRLADNDAAYADERRRMDEREKIYRGMREVDPLVDEDRLKRTPHVRNLVFELIETQVSSSIPQPKVTARYEKDTAKAKLIEDMIRNELDRLPMEELNDMMERTVPMQGGGVWLVEWDEGLRTPMSIGEVCVSVVHPKQIVPQDGVYSSIEDMDYFILKVPQTKQYIYSRWGVDVDGEGESEPDIKSVDGASANDMVTQYIAYYRGEDGAIGVYSWVNDVEIYDIEDYQTRRVKVCGTCGSLDAPSGDGEHCPRCGGTLKTEKQEEELIFRPIETRYGVIPGASLQPGGELVPTKIPYYKPDIYPCILQKSVSVYGQLLGDSDIDKIADQQNTTNRIEAKIIERLVRAGTRITLPDRADIVTDPRDGEVWRVQSPAELGLIRTYDFSGDLNYEMRYLAQVYEEARQTIGITDSFQGRKDTTATSKVSKEFAAQQSAGRLESKRAMKNAAWSRIFEAIFKFKLAYADEPRPVMSRAPDGSVEYEMFSRYDFLEHDEAGNWYYNDAFLFSCDSSAPLANNREAMWQEARLNLQSGAFGDPSALSTLILFWGRMEQLFYPGAAETKRYLEGQLEAQQQQQAEAQAQQEAMQAAQFEEAQARAAQEADIQRQAQAEAQARRLDEVARAAAQNMTRERR